MNFKNAFWLCLFVCALSCAAFAEDQPYVRMGTDLTEVKSDFNEAVDQVRLVLIVGPT